MKSKNNKKRVDLILRLQGYANDPITEVIEYLKSLPDYEMRQRINSFLVGGFLPYARHHQGNYESEEISYLCWQSEDILSKHSFYMRCALRVKQQQLAQSQYIPTNPTVYTNNSIQSQTDDEMDDDDEIDEPQPIIKGEMSSEDIDRIFGD